MMIRGLPCSYATEAMPKYTAAVWNACKSRLGYTSDTKDSEAILANCDLHAIQTWYATFAAYPFGMRMHKTKNCLRFLASSEREEDVAQVLQSSKMLFMVLTVDEGHTAGSERLNAVPGLFVSSASAQQDGTIQGSSLHVFNCERSIGRLFAADNQFFHLSKTLLSLLCVPRKRLLNVQLTEFLEDQTFAELQFQDATLSIIRAHLRDSLYVPGCMSETPSGYSVEENNAGSERKNRHMRFCMLDRCFICRFEPVG